MEKKILTLWVGRMLILVMRYNRYIYMIIAGAMVSMSQPI